MSRIIEINKSIAEIENISPANDIISSYQDFLKHREYLHFYQYNEAVFVSLIDLTHGLWNSNERISRASLISVTKRYIKKAETTFNIPTQTATKIFELFKEIVYSENLNLSKESVELAKKAINRMMIGIKLDDNQLQWLCDHSDHSDFMLNRLLRYHRKSHIISKWAKQNFEKDFARNRRSEITSWIIDENPKFKIDMETIGYDFEYQIIEDKKLVEIYKQEVDTYRFYEKEVRPLIPARNEPFVDEDGIEYKLNIQKTPVLNRPRRHYNGHSKSYLGFGLIPDFDHFYTDFYDKFDYHYNRIMAWSIAYSRLNIDKKISLLSEYYSSETYPTFLTIGKRLKSVEYFKWLKQMV